MPASRQLERTRVPGIYKRGNRYVVIYRANARPLAQGWRE